MAMTKGGFTSADGPGSSSKHVVQGQAKGPEGTGNYTGNVSGSQAQTDGGTNDAKAKAIYGSTSAPAGTRMPRMASEAQEASDATPGWGDDNAQQAFIDGSNAPGFKTINGPGSEFGSGSFGPGGLPTSHEVPGVDMGSPGFPGLPDDVSGQGVDTPVATQGGRGAAAVGRAPSIINPPTGFNPPGAQGSSPFPLDPGYGGENK
jgi:hypothetical protein